MKTPEDEAFDDLAKKQGAWGGGFKAKKAMAADKLQEPVTEHEALKLSRQLLWRYRHETPMGHQPHMICHQADEAFDRIDEALAQPAQEPDVVMHWESHTWTINNPPPKGSGDVNLYYAPPQRFWVGLTEKQIEVIEEKALTKQWAIRMTIAQLKECNA